MKFMLLLKSDEATESATTERALRVPLKSGQIEVRQVFDVSEFDQDNEFVQKEIKWREEHGESRTA